MTRRTARTAAASLALCSMLSLPAPFGAAPARAQEVGTEPVNDRFTVRLVGEKYVLWGFRAGPLQERGEPGGRFRLETGMTAGEASAQLTSVEWDHAELKLDDPNAPTATVQRRRPLFKDVEQIHLELDKTTRRVQRITYEVEPVNRSHYGLLVYLNADYGAGEKIIDTDEHVQIGYRTGPAQRMLVDANLLGTDRPQWRLRYQIQDPTIVGGRSPAGEHQPGEPRELIEIWPPASQPAEEKQDDGLIQVYPPPKKQNG